MSAKPSCRLMWMFPRNIRYIDPWKLVQIATLLEAATGVISDQHYQDFLYDELEKLGLKAKKNPYGVKNPGGFRTYLAQLACLGLFWKDRASNSYQTTYAGELFLEAKEPSKILRCQLLRMQYPSVYGLGQNVAVSPDLKVKPFAFLCRLLQDERLGRALTSDEMAVPVVYGRTMSDYERVVTKILEFRQHSDFARLIDSVDDLRTPKRFDETAPNEDFRKGIEDALTIGNTAKNYMEATGLIVPVTGTKAFELNPDPSISDEVERWMREADVIEKLDPDHTEAWQQRYGRYDKTKAVRSLSRGPRADGFETMVRTRYLAQLTASPYSFDNLGFVETEAARWGKPASEVAKAIAPLKNRRKSVERDVVMRAAASGGREAIVLEKAVTAILCRLGFDSSVHIGQKAVPAQFGRAGGYPDIRILKSGDAVCGFGDTKATMNYDFVLSDMQKLGTYYRDCWQEFEDQIPSGYFVYIAGGFGRASRKVTDQKLAYAGQQYGRPVTAVTVSALLDIDENAEKLSVTDLEQVFSSGKLFTSGEEVILSLHS